MRRLLILSQQLLLSSFLLIFKSWLLRAHPRSLYIIGKSHPPLTMYRSILRRILGHFRRRLHHYILGMSLCTRAACLPVTQVLLTISWVYISILWASSSTFVTRSFRDLESFGALQSGCSPAGSEWLENIVIPPGSQSYTKHQSWLEGVDLSIQIPIR